MDKRIVGLVGGLVATLLFLAVNVLGNEFLSSTRIDLTEDELFTLSEGSKNIAKDLEEPLRLSLYYSEDAGREVPGAKEYHRRVRDVLREYVRNSGGNILLEEIDPEPFSEEEEEATAEGIASIPTRPDPLYFGLVGTNATDDRQVIAFFGDVAGGGVSFERKERFLEYDLSRLIYSLANPDKKKVGVLSTLPIQGAPGNPMMQQQGTPAWLFLDQLGYFLDLAILSPADEELPDDLDALLLVHPRELSDTLLYAVDQYVLGGGKLVALVDPHCEADMSGNDPQNPAGSFGASKGSDLNRLFNAWGFEVVPNKVVGDLDGALGVRMPTGATSFELVDYVVWMDVAGDRLDGEDPVTSLLDQLRVIAPGSIRPLEGATTRFESLVQTSEDSMEIDVGRLQFQPDPAGLLETFVSSKEPLTLVARVSGDVPSAFPDGSPGGPAVEETEGAEGTEEGADDASHLTVSDGPAHMVVIADADLLYDQWWIQRTIFGAQKSADNCDLVLNAIENLTGGEDLISIRARGRYSRPFDRVEEIEQDAQRRLRSTEQDLERRMQAAEEKISALQEERDPSDPTSQVFLSPEQLAAYDEAMEDRRELRRQLRDVRHDMDKDIESLGLKVKALNIAGLPLLVSALAIGLGLWRIQRRGTR